MFEFKQTDNFRDWWRRLKNERARGLISSRLNRLAYGHAGDVAPVGEGISELRIHHGPGYRIYFRKQGRVLIILLCGGDKSSQSSDIKTAKRLAIEWST
jgi:putative addiction module killer protein